MICVCKVNPCVWPACPAGQSTVSNEYLVEAPSPEQVNEWYNKVVKPVLERREVKMQSKYKPSGQGFSINEVNKMEITASSGRHKKLDAIEFDGKKIPLEDIHAIELIKSNFIIPMGLKREGLISEKNILKCYLRNPSSGTATEVFQSTKESLSVYNELITIWKEYLDNKDK